ncbi:putative polyketide synthase [Astrocystis sublimbata]|nr:putative polyketide synthase [Astrocystis sublimbata]
MGCRLPGDSNSPHALWQFLERGGIADNQPPETRFQLDTHYDGSKKPYTMRSPGGMFLESIDPQKFDAAFCGIGRVDAVAMDPQQRQLLEVVYECLENSGIPLEALDGKNVGCFIGSYAVDYADMQARDPDDRVPSVTIGIGRAILSNRISHFLNIHGPSMTIDTACSGSLVGLDVACRYLTTGEIDGAIIGGANLYLSPEHVMDAGPMKGASSLSGRCHTFDKKADGYIKAEGINCVMLKRLRDAERDGDPIRAIIRGTATNSDGRTPGIASPSARAQAAVTLSAYSNAGITDLSTTAYIEMHGTGTQAGDPEEVRGAASVFSPTRPQSSPLVIGSIKSNIGHSEPAAGISGLIKAVLSVENGRIPGNPTFVDPNPSIDFEGARVRATRWTIPWPAGHELRRASVNSFGYGGSNAHCIVDEVPVERRNFKSCFSSNIADDFLADADAVEISRPHVIVLSANDEASLKAYSESLRKHLLNPKVNASLDSLAYTLSERRSHHFHRGYMIGFIFTGQGSQWSRMGHSLLENFPVALETIKRLDVFLRDFKHPPAWSLLEELTAARDAAMLREPEYSQPLVTALQIAIVNLLNSWDIAAAYAAGLLSEKEALQAAYYRGYAAKTSRRSRCCDMGMLAVGLNSKRAQAYVDEAAESSHSDSGAVSIACYNSPESVTLSGPKSSLEAVRVKILADGHFSRMLQVDMAYHSSLMHDVGESYAQFLEEEHFAPSTVKTPKVKMFSSVDGEWTRKAMDIAYWQSNMVQPVLFGQVLTQMLTGKDSPDFLIEIGPSGTLAGPVAQVKKELPGGGSNIQYCSAMTRGQGAEDAIFDTAGKLFVAGYRVNMAEVNGVAAHHATPKILTDLPNYCWNRERDYWYENEASRDWRYRRFPHHDLLGSKILGTPWAAPAWKKTLAVEDLPWLGDHRLGPDIVFPGAGYMCMAVEAMRQTDSALRQQIGEDVEMRQQTRLRNVTFDKALVLEEGKGTRIMLNMAPLANQQGGWYSWVIRSLVLGSWIDHCKGQVRMENDGKAIGSSSEMATLKYATPGAAWYKSMFDVGYRFGKSFQKLQLVETVSGSRSCRSHVDLVPPSSQYAQSKYPMHPAVLDGCMQSCAPALWNGIKSSVNAVLVPAVIDDVLVKTPWGNLERGISVSQSSFAGPGREEETKNYASHAKIYDSVTGELVLALSGLRYHKLDFQDSAYAAHRYSRLEWGPDLTLSPQACRRVQGYGDGEAVQHILDLVAFKKPNARVLEVLLAPGETSSMWLEGLGSASKPRKSYSSLVVMTDDATALVTAQARYGAMPRTAFSLLATAELFGSGVEEPQQNQFDFILLRLGGHGKRRCGDIIPSARKILGESGLFMVFEQENVCSNGPSVDPQSAPLVNGSGPGVEEMLDESGFEVTKASDERPFWLARPSTPNSHENPIPLDIIHLSSPGRICHSISAALKSFGWDVREMMVSTFEQQLRADATCLVITELEAPQLPTLTAELWTAIQKLLQKQNKILWLSEASQWKVRNPDGAMIHGLCRSIRTEDPFMSIITLDVEDAESIDTMLRRLQQETPSVGGFDGEYVERGGIFHVSRILGDDAVNAMDAAKATGPPPVNMSLHEASTTIRMVAERPGSIDSLHFHEIDSAELLLPENKVEVELFASALNFKDIAVTMGIVPENHHLLGLEGAGTIRRVGEKLHSHFHVGQRVLVFEKGAFANRIIATTERTIAIPDWLSFEDAATLPSVYLTALYSLQDLAAVKAGDRVLIHSATGGLGIASIQICQSVGAEIFATVGQDDKKQFLMDHYGIPADHVFSSRDRDFAEGIMSHTHGYGVDIILNSLTGDLLDASWRCIAEGGTMVELGKKDFIDRNSLSMEPFSRNASYRCFDMSHKHVTDEVIQSLMRRMMDLIISGQVKPISPVTLFPYHDIPAAMRFMRSANHIGKIIISNKECAEPVSTVAVRPAPRTLKLREDVSYMIVGGLRGLCGSLALDMARHGARSLVVLSRSGTNDSKSQAVLKDLEAHGCHTESVCGDVADLDDVHRAFKSAAMPVAGVIQGAMVLRDRPFELMTHDDYTTATRPKVAGTWNLHNTAIQLGLTLDFFTMLSSISGLIGQPTQANYAAANVFLDSFAYYRRGLGLKANSVDLGAIDDIGYMAEHSNLIEALDTSAWTPINEALFQTIVQYSLMQQEPIPLNPDSSSQLITSIAIPQPPSSRLISDARFASLLSGSSAGTEMIAPDATDADRGIQALHLAIKSGADMSAVLPKALELVNKQFMVTLRVEDPLEPGKPLSAYGLDSLAAVEFRNWSRARLGAELTTLEITGAQSLMSLAEKIVSKIQVGGK